MDMCVDRQKEIGRRSQRGKVNTEGLKVADDSRGYNLPSGRTDRVENGQNISSDIPKGEYIRRTRKTRAMLFRDKLEKFT